MCPWGKVNIMQENTLETRTGCGKEHGGKMGWRSACTLYKRQKAVSGFLRVDPLLVDKSSQTTKQVKHCIAKSWASDSCGSSTNCCHPIGSTQLYRMWLSCMLQHYNLTSLQLFSILCTKRAPRRRSMPGLELKCQSLLYKPQPDLNLAEYTVVLNSPI